jgi:hypothetical protein
MKETLTDSAMISVMTRLWKEILITIEGLLVPPMSDKLSQQKPLTQQELDTVFKWLQVSNFMSETFSLSLIVISFSLISSTLSMKKQALLMAYRSRF